MDGVEGFVDLSVVLAELDQRSLVQEPGRS